MLIEINSLDSGSGVNTNLDIYLAYNESRKLFEQQPFCRIDQNDLCEILPQKEVAKLETGKIYFRISKASLIEKANKIY